jgi:hypothetical protein
MFGKSSIIGLYGMAPYAEILVKEIGKPMERLTVLLFTEPSDGGNFKLAPKLFGPDDKLVAEFQEQPFPTAPGKRISLSIVIVTPVFPSEGRYKFVLISDGTKVYDTTFNVRVAPAETFSKS